MLESPVTTEYLLKKETLSLWAWGLLARCRDAGELASEDIGVLRDVGKKAVSVLRGLRAVMDVESRNAEVEDEESGDETDKTHPAEETLATVGTQNQDEFDVTTESDSRKQLTRLLVTFDLIITMVGEFCGQRDLLDGRIVWDELDQITE